MTLYIEVHEEVTEDNEFKPREMVRKYVKDIAEAESEYAKITFNKGKSIFVEMNHDIDYSKTKPCIAKEIKDGKVVV